MKRYTNNLYGRIAIPKGYCKDCDSQAFILDGKFQCCDAAATGSTTKVTRICDPIGRKIPPLADRESILETQHQACFYCGRYFGSVVSRQGKQITLRIEWDHLVPYSYQSNNTTKNFVAACRICNRLKSSFMFQTLQEAQVYLLQRWKEKGYEG